MMNKFLEAALGPLVVVMGATIALWIGTALTIGHWLASGDREYLTPLAGFWIAWLIGIGLPVAVLFAAVWWHDRRQQSERERSE